MACMQNNNTQSNNYIYDTLTKIDQMQKEASIKHACDGCEGSLISAFYNTKPITIYLCSGVTFSVLVPDTSPNQTTNVFRIENVKGDSVILRLLQNVNNELTCTNYTAVLKIDCICGLQCFSPMCCDACMSTCGAN